MDVGGVGVPGRGEGYCRGPWVIGDGVGFREGEGEGGSGGRW